MRRLRGGRFEQGQRRSVFVGGDFGEGIPFQALGLGGGRLRVKEREPFLRERSQTRFQGARLAHRGFVRSAAVEVGSASRCVEAGGGAGDAEKEGK